MDSTIEDRKVAMGLVSIFLTLMDSKIVQSQFSNYLRVDGFHALVVVSSIFFLCHFLYSVFSPFCELNLTLVFFLARELKNC